jgi:hypothetical protein
MSRPALLLSLLAVVALLLAGCVTPPDSLTTAASTGGIPDLLAAPASLWPDHENEPHPGFGWPTLTHPAIANGTGTVVPSWWEPIANATIPANIQGLKHVAKGPSEVTQGAGIAVFGRLALVPSDAKDSWVLDITDPAKPEVLSTYDGHGGRGAGIMAFPDGRLYGVVSTTPGFDVVNLTDPHNATVVAQVKAPRGGHKTGIVPGTPFVYNANSNGAESGTPLDIAGDIQATAKGGTEIYDLTNPEAPVLVQDFKNGYGCHHIFFWIDGAKDRERAICAGMQYTQIWDIKDPKAPKVIVSVPVHHGVTALPATSVVPFAFSHFAILNEKGDMLIVGDEMGGGAIPPGCSVPGAPTGALWFYDIKDEKNPVLQGWFSPGTHLAKYPQNDFASCTAHHGRLVPDPAGKKQLIALAFYGAGTVLVDFTNPMLPTMVDQWTEADANTWEAWYYNGYVFTGDLGRGFDVLTLR